MSSVYHYQPLFRFHEGFLKWEGGPFPSLPTLATVSTKRPQIWPSTTCDCLENIPSSWESTSCYVWIIMDYKAKTGINCDSSTRSKMRTNSTDIGKRFTIGTWPTSRRIWINRWVIQVVKLLSKYAGSLGIHRRVSEVKKLIVLSR